ncbi:MAG: iron transporter [Gammaproteobacteria bacterium]
MIRKLLAAIALAALLPLATAHAAETSLGNPIVKDHMIVHAVYLQPVSMSPVLPGLESDPAHSDVHLEADIHADKNEPHGFQPGEWIPYLTVSYLLQKQHSDWQDFGTFMVMEADDGPHYGANVKLDGPGKYTLSLKIKPPPYAAFFRHTSKDTGVPPWWKPFTVSWIFVWAGNGKLGGY